MKITVTKKAFYNDRVIDEGDTLEIKVDKEADLPSWAIKFKAESDKPTEEVKKEITLHDMAKSHKTNVVEPSKKQKVKADGK